MWCLLQSPPLSSGLPFLSSSVMGDVCGPEATYITSEVSQDRDPHPHPPPTITIGCNLLSSYTYNTTCIRDGNEYSRPGLSLGHADDRLILLRRVLANFELTIWYFTLYNISYIAMESFFFWFILPRGYEIPQNCLCLVCKNLNWTNYLSLKKKTFYIHYFGIAMYVTCNILIGGKGK